FLLSEILSGQESELESLHRRVNELAELLGLEKRQARAMRTEMTELSGMIGRLTLEKEALTSQLTDMTQRSEMDRSEMKRQLLEIAGLQEDINALRIVRRELEERVEGLAAALTSKDTELGALRDRSKALEARLSDEQERTMLAQKEIQQSEIRIQALSVLVGEQERLLEDERQLSSSTRAEVALLNRQIEVLKKQLEEIGRALDRAEAEKSARESELKDLGKRLNIVLARQVNKLERYRSEFFGRLREIVGDSPDVRVEGDRFVLQSELLFDSGSADLGEKGKVHLGGIAETLRQLSKKIPEDIDWILRIDGHTDRVPINNERFASNWELSTARAGRWSGFSRSRGSPLAG
ncbi:MAG: OmpA family protein, partial [Pseudomonadota bacterium]